MPVFEDNAVVSIRALIPSGFVDGTLEVTSHPLSAGEEPAEIRLTVELEGKDAKVAVLAIEQDQVRVLAEILAAILERSDNREVPCQEAE